MEPIILKISKLPDGRYNLSTNPHLALSEAELRNELLALDHPERIVDGLIRMGKRL